MGGLRMCPQVCRQKCGFAPRSGRARVWGWGMSLGSSSRPAVSQNLPELRGNGPCLHPASRAFLSQPHTSFENRRVKRALWGDGRRGGPPALVVTAHSITDCLC